MRRQKHARGYKMDNHDLINGYRNNIDSLRAKRTFF